MWRFCMAVGGSAFNNTQFISTCSSGNYLFHLFISVCVSVCLCVCVIVLKMTSRLPKCSWMTRWFQHPHRVLEMGCTCREHFFCSELLNWNMSWKIQVVTYSAKRNCCVDSNTILQCVNYIGRRVLVCSQPFQTLNHVFGITSTL